MDLATTNNQTFIRTFSLATWASLVDLTQAHFRMEIRPSPSSANVALSFDSESGAPDRGTAKYDEDSRVIILRAPYEAVRNIVSGQYVWDLIFILPLPNAGDPLVKVLAAGKITFAEGVSRDD